MAYRICYHELRQKKQRINSLIAYQILWAGVLMCVVLLSGTASSRWREGVEILFLPSEEQSVQTFASDYARGKEFRQILVAHCRNALIEAGYEG